MANNQEVMTNEEVKKNGVGLKDLSTGQKVVGLGVVGAAAYGIYAGGKAALDKAKKTKIGKKINSVTKTVISKLPKFGKKNDQESNK